MQNIESTQKLKQQLQANAHHYLEIVKVNVESGPFDGILIPSVNSAFFVFFQTSPCSQFRVENRLRAYDSVFQRLDDICHTCWEERNNILKKHNINPKELTAFHTSP